MQRTRVGFRVQPLYRIKRQTAAHYAKQRLSFMVAVLSLLAFVMGNMVGQHGWYAFWRSVLGKAEDSMIVFTGTVPPIAYVPDYAEWAKYGGDKRVHTFSQVPSQALRPLPDYDPVSLARNDQTFARRVYTTPWAAGYNTPSGSHAGVDIDAPRGTPVVSIAAGVVEKVSFQDYGYGHYVLVRHPNVPDVTKPEGVTELWSTYAHLDAITVKEGEVVRKGQTVGTVGNTGTVFGATGYHLYFSIDTADAPYHPYWPFTSSEAQAAGMNFVQAVDSTLFRDRVLQYTLNPMLFVQQHLNTSTVVATRSAAPETPVVRLSPRELAAKRRAGRVARQPLRTATVAVPAPAQAPAAVVGTPVQEASLTVPESVSSVIKGTNVDVDRLHLTHDVRSARSWQKLTIKALDKNGNTVRSPAFDGRLYVIATFGDAEIRPTELSSLDFVGGVATVNVLPRSQKTLILETRGAFTAVADPMTFDR